MLLRLAEPSDAAAIAAVYRPYVEQTPISFETLPPDSGEMAARMAEVQPHLPWLVAEEHGVVFGFSYGHPFAPRAAYAWSVETSVYVGLGQHRRGVGRRLYAALLDLLALQGYQEAFAGVTLPNPGSVGLHEVMGFERVATFRRAGWKLGAWHDVGWWQRHLGSAVGTPLPTRGVGDLPAEQVAAVLAGGG